MRHRDIGNFELMVMLALIRLGRKSDALGEFERATVLEPRNARFAYVYGVALHSMGQADAAISLLEKALVAHPSDASLMAALASFRNEGGRTAAAKK